MHISGYTDLQDGSCIQMPKSPKSEPVSCVVSLRLPIADVEKIDAIAGARGVSRSRVLNDIIEKRGLLQPKDDRGLQLERLRALRRLQVLLDRQACDGIDRQRQLQKIFDEVYDNFFASMNSTAGEGEDGRQ